MGEGNKLRGAGKGFPNVSPGRSAGSAPKQKTPPPPPQFLLWATGVFADGISSADVVGYASNNLRWGSIGLVPQFAGVASADGSFDLQTITCSDNSSDSVSFSILNNTGLNGDSYLWIDYYENPETGEFESCWVDGAFEKVKDFKVTPGMGLWVQADSSDQYITFPGVELN